MKSIEEKVRDLLAKATDPAASPAEAETAMRMAQKLMDKHGLSEDDIKARGADAFTEWTVQGRKTKYGAAFHPIDKYLGHYIAKFVGCRKWRQLTTGGDNEEAVYFGIESDVEFALHLRSAWMAHFDLHWEIYRTEHPRLRDMKAARQSFSIEFAKEMRNRLEAWAAPQRDDPDAETRNALVVKKQDLVQAEMDRRGIHLQTGAGPKSMGVNVTAAGAGIMAARTASVGRGVGPGTVKLLS